MDFPNFWIIASESISFKMAEKLWESLIGRVSRFTKEESGVSYSVETLREFRGTGLRETAEKNIRDGFLWEKIIADCRDNREPAEFNGDDDTGRCYIGSVLSLYPSGKYYQPFACSNVEPCPLCNGDGSIKNPDRCDALADFAQEIRPMLSSYTMETFGPACNGGWPSGLADVLSRIDVVRAESLSVVTCPHCNGVGSREAFEDEIFSEALSAVAESHGGWIESGDGDGCDVFFGMSLETAEPETAETE